jgi:SP family general alpha glucoside:H+ symporter-like MFS transporter
MSALEAMKKNPMAVVWSLVISTCVIMEGYDTNLLSNFMAYPSFTHRYGVPVPGSDVNQIPPAWQAGLGQASGAGAFLGTLLVGYLVNIFGQRRVILGALIMMSIGILFPFLAPNLTVLVIGQVRLNPSETVPN